MWDTLKMFESLKTGIPVSWVYKDDWLITDTRAGKSRGFGFIRFPSLSEAEAFMNKNFPMIYIYGDSSKGNVSDEVKVRIAYGRERKEVERVQDTDWVCKIVCL